MDALRYGYDIIKYKGGGAFAKVYKAKVVHDRAEIAPKDNVVALKVFLDNPYAIDDKNDFSFTRKHAGREVDILSKLDHPHVVKLLHVHYVGEDTPDVCPIDPIRATLVLEYAPLDFCYFPYHMYETVHSARQVIRKLMRQLLQAVQYCHSQKVIHRDISPTNVFMTYSHESNAWDMVKLGDFGGAKYMGDEKKCHVDPDETHLICTIICRASELLMGGLSYDELVDIWSCGKIMLSLLMMTWTRDYYMDALGYPTSDDNMRDRMFLHMGLPTDEDWPSVSETPEFPCEILCEKRYTKLYAGSVVKNMGAASWALMTPAAGDLVDKLLAYNPAKRISATEALNHPYFSEEEIAWEEKTKHKNIKWPAPLVVAEPRIKQTLKHNTAPQFAKQVVESAPQNEGDAGITKPLLLAKGSKGSAKSCFSCVVM